MNISNSYINVLRYVSTSGKKTVLETFNQTAKKGTNFKYIGPAEYKTVPIGMPKSYKYIEYDKWENDVLRIGGSKSQSINNWLGLIAPHPPIELTRIEKELKKCFSKENIEKIEFFKTLTPQEKEYISECYTEPSFMATLTGHKPAWYNEHGFWGKVDFSKIKLNPKVADKFDVVRLPNKRSLYFLNKKEVMKIIEENKDIYCAGQGLSHSESVENIYNTLLKNLEQGKIAEGKKGEALFGITLGFPRHSSMIYEMEKVINGYKRGLRENTPKLKEELLELLHSDKTPFKGYPKETIEILENHIKTMNINDGVITSICQCHTFGNEAKAIERLIEKDKHFKENFKVEDLM